MTPERVVLTLGALSVPVDVSASSDHATVTVGDTVLTLALEPVGAGMYAVTCNGHRALAHYARDGDIHYLHVNGVTYSFERGGAEQRQPARRSPATTAGYADVRAPMPGVVTQVFVKEGQAVAAGDPLYVVEAMKIETVVRASAPLRVGRVPIAPGTQVEGGAVVVEVENLEG